MPPPVLTAYATPANWQAYTDWHEIGELISDSAELISANDQLTHPVVIELLNSAAGDIETSFMVSGMYAITDLTGLVGNSKEKLIRLNCERATFYLYRRKPLQFAEQLKTFREMTEHDLDLLRTGMNVFNIAAQINAGTPEAKGLSTVQMSQSGLTAYHPGMHYFPAPQSIFGNG